MSNLNFVTFYVRNSNSNLLLKKRNTYLCNGTSGNNIGYIEIDIADMIYENKLKYRDANERENDKTRIDKWQSLGQYYTGANYKVKCCVIINYVLVDSDVPTKKIERFSSITSSLSSG